MDSIERDIILGLYLLNGGRSGTDIENGRVRAYFRNNRSVEITAGELEIPVNRLKRSLWRMAEKGERWMQGKPTRRWVRKKVIY